MNKYEFKQLNEEPIPIECVPDEHDETRDFHPSFWWNSRRYYTEDFVRTHNNPWIGAAEYPEYIHAYEANEYVRPLYLELIGDAEVNVYEERLVEADA